MIYTSSRVLALKRYLGLTPKKLTSGRSFSLRHDLQLSVDADGGLGGEEDGVVGLAHDAVEHALEEAGAVSQSDEHQSLALSAQAMDPAENLQEKMNIGNEIVHIVNSVKI